MIRVDDGRGLSPSVPRVVIVPTGTANTASVVGALRRLGAHAAFATQGADIERATHVVLPGVGTLRAAMDHLRACGFDGALRERVRALRPTLCICLGMQMLCEGSEESPGCAGLGAIPAVAARLGADGVRVPHLGWSAVTWDERPEVAGPCADGDAYFAHSFAVRTPVEGWRAASATHGEKFIAALSRGGVLACQFHPELSGPWGQALIGAWLSTRESGGVECR